MAKFKEAFKSDKTIKILCIALVLIILSGLGASAFESSGYSVKVKDIEMTWAQFCKETKANTEAYGKDIVITYDGSNGSKDMTASNNQIALKLLIPANASASNPAPGIVDVHGFYNNKEMQDAFYVELARRGYVVAVVDMAGHGNSDVTFDPSANIILATDNSGMEPVLEWLMSQPYVDEAKMGITGHSQGGRACGWLMQHLIRAGHGDYVKAYLGQSNSAGLTAILDEFGEYPETLSTGTIMCQYDEFSIVRDNSYDYLNFEQSARLIGQAYPDITAPVVAGQLYTAEGPVTPDIANGETVNGKAAVVYWPNIIHPWAHFSTRCSGYATTFFYSVLGIPSGAKFINPSNQIWLVKEIFNFIGLIGLLLLIVPVTKLLLRLPAFSSLKKSREEIDARLPDYKGFNKLSFWLNGILTSALVAIIFQTIYSNYRFGNTLFPCSQRYPQTTANTIGMWSAICGLICIGLLLIFWALRTIASRKTGYKENPFAVADVSSVREFLKAAFLGILVVAILYVIVFAQKAIWGTDFRLWVLAIVGFEFTKVGTIIRYIPFFLLFYVCSAICNANSRLKGLSEGKSLFFTCLFSVLGLIVICIIEYSSMVNKGTQAIWMFGDDSIMFAVSAALGYILLFPIIPMLVVANIVNRKIYLETGSIWVGAFITGILFTIMFCANTFTQYAYVLTA